MRKIFYLAQTACWLTLCFLAMFYGLFFKGRQMQPWSIILLALAVVGYIVCLGFGVKLVHNGNVERSERVLCIIAMLPVYVLIALPALFMLLLFSDKRRDRFAFLKKLGFIRRKTDGEVIYTKGETIIVIKRNEVYDISFDGGESFLPIEDTELGTQEERDKLVSVMFEYVKGGKTASHAEEPDVEFADFVRRYVTD